jgi:hypothetical protein
MIKKYLLILILALFGISCLVSCSDNWTHKGTITKHGILYYDPFGSVMIINTNIIPNKIYYAIQLKEYPGVSFLMNLTQGKNYSGYKELEEVDQKITKTAELLAVMPEVKSNKTISLQCKDTGNKKYFKIIKFKEN